MPSGRPCIAFIIGTGYGGEDVLAKEPWAVHLDGVDVVAASRIDPHVHLAREDLPVRRISTQMVRDALARMEAKVSIEMAHQHPDFTGDVWSQTEAETWLGVSLESIIDKDRRFRGRRRRAQDLANETALRWTHFFRAFYDRHRPSHFVTTIEDDLFSLAAYHAAKAAGVTVVEIQVDRFPDRGAMLVEDFRSRLDWNVDLPPMNEILDLYKDGEVTGEVQQQTRGYWELASFPRRIKDAKFARVVRSFRKRVVNAYRHESCIIPPPQLLKRAIEWVLQVYRRYTMRALTQLPMAGDAYFVYPCHFLDDAQVTFREPGLSQELLIGKIASALPTNTKLYVKPHPHYHGSDMALRSLQRISKMPGVVIMEPEVRSRPLVRAAVGVVVLNSTVGFEALVMDTPVIALGDDFYCHEPPCHVANVDDLTHVMKDVVEGKRIARADVEFFIRATRANTILVEGAGVGLGWYWYTDEDGRRIAHSLRKALGFAS